MTISDLTPYEGDLDDGYEVQASDWNGMFGAIQSYINDTLVPAVNTLINAPAPVTGKQAFCNGRLTVVTGDPFPVTDQTAKTTVFFTPFKGNFIGLYNGTTWDLLTFAELSIAVPATTNQMYDVFIFNNGGTAALELLAWTNDTTRATALVRQDGVLSKTGALTRRFIGCIRTTGVSGQTELSFGRVLVVNYYNLKWRVAKAVDATASWTSTNTSYHTANGNTTPGVGRVDFISCFGDELVQADSITTAGTSNTTFTTGVGAGIGLDSLTVSSAQLHQPGSPIASGSIGSNEAVATARDKGYPAAGYHFLQNLEAAAAAGTTTFFGTSALKLSGLFAVIPA